MAEFKSRYKNYCLNVRGRRVQFDNFLYRTKNIDEIDYMTRNQGSDYVRLDKPEKNSEESIRIQARDLGYQGNWMNDKKSDLLEFIESKK